MTKIEELRLMKVFFEELYGDKDLTPHDLNQPMLIDYWCPETHELWTAFVLGWNRSQDYAARRTRN